MLEALCLSLLQFAQGFPPCELQVSFMENVFSPYGSNALINIGNENVHGGRNCHLTVRACLQTHQIHPAWAGEPTPLLKMAPARRGLAEAVK